MQQHLQLENIKKSYCPLVPVYGPNFNIYESTAHNLTPSSCYKIIKRQKKTKSIDANIYRNRHILTQQNMQANFLCTITVEVKENLVDYILHAQAYINVNHGSMHKQSMSYLNDLFKYGTVLSYVS